MLAKWLFSGALAFEASSWAGLASSPGLLEGLLVAVLPHAAASALLTLAVWRLLPARYRRPLPWSPLFLFSLAFFIPVLGAVGLIAAVFPALYTQRSHDEPMWQSLGVPKLPFRPLESGRSPMFHDGGLQDVLNLASDPEQRLAALMATRRMPAHDSIPILKLALRDSSDDVRLLAYSMLDQKESRINQRIERLIEEIGSDGAGSAAQHAALARWYWELAYLGLAQGSVLDHVLDQAWTHSARSLELEPNPELDLLAGRVALERGDIVTARHQFNSARLQGVSPDKVLPFLAEAAFVSGRYAEVRRLLHSLPAGATLRPPFADIARYWT
ncbi:HEAT repeat domain-containing protein [Halopseudomonas nanhaiensis]|uniref:HEAT repeat domain-containing protein n=1 Tax=Halopseudomonas nanhaiensis TaxID=2830842 RepID=UPI001CBE2197|nr:HEAT repeat domain-containing protein [Halopseudomonas nanhaiensis]UAW99491.1 HEAT repeat domain-containing protein [Halopseudomonas nanhaiensis]